MGIYKRFRNIIASKIERNLKERENPLDVLEYTFSKQQTHLINITSHSVTLKATRDRLTKSCETYKELIDKHELDAKTAIHRGDEQEALAAASRKLDAQQIFEESVKHLSELNDQVNSVGKEVENTKSEINRLKMVREKIRSQMIVAQTKASTAKLDGAIDDIVNESNKHITMLEVEAEVHNELNSANSIDKQLSELTTTSNAAAELERIKKQLKA